MKLRAELLWLSPSKNKQVTSYSQHRDRQLGASSAQPPRIFCPVVWGGVTTQLLTFVGMTSPRPAYPFFFLFFFPGMTRHPTDRRPAWPRGAWNFSRAIRSPTPGGSWRVESKMGRTCQSWEVCLFWEHFCHSAKELSLKGKKKMPINNYVLRDCVLHENLPLGHWDFSTQNKFAHE